MSRVFFSLFNSKEYNCRAESEGVRLEKVLNTKPVVIP